MLPREIYSIKKYNYPEGGTPTDKILIILDITADKLLVLEARLTSRDSEIEKSALKHGCNNDLNTDGTPKYSFYMFTKDKRVGAKNDQSMFSFKLNTFLFFGDNINKVERADYLQYTPPPQKMGEISKGEYEQIMACAKNSQFIKRGLKTAFPTFFAPPVAPITTVVISPKI